MFYFKFDFYGREQELDELNSLYRRDGFKFVVVYGRRRVGKSSLIQKFISEGNKPSISFMALEQNDKYNLDSFSEIIMNRFDDTRDYLTSFKSWEKALDYIISKVKDERLVLFIDEYPYVANSNPSISSILQKYIDGDFQKTNIMLILCGSSMSFMEAQVLGRKSPLYGRRDMQFKVEPFDYYDSAKFFDKWIYEDKAVAYAVTGGIPQYLNKLKAYDSLSEGIKNEFLKKSGSLYEEPRNLLMQELREPAVYNTILSAISKGATKPNEISTKTGEENRKVSKYLLSLIGLHIIKREIPMLSKQQRNGIYVIVDNMFKFWYRCVLPNVTNIESGMHEYVYEQKIVPEMSSYMGRVFEEISIQFLKRQNKNMNLPFVYDSIGRWWGNNPDLKRQEEIDIIATSKESIIFAECKWKDTVGIEVLEDLKRKALLFEGDKKQYFYLFSKGYFTKAVKDKAKEDESIKLIELRDMYF